MTHFGRGLMKSHRHIVSQLRTRKLVFSCATALAFGIAFHCHAATQAAAPDVELSADSQAHAHQHAEPRSGDDAFPVHEGMHAMSMRGMYGPYAMTRDASG